MHSSSQIDTTNETTHNVLWCIICAIFSIWTVVKFAAIEVGEILPSRSEKLWICMNMCRQTLSQLGYMLLSRVRGQQYMAPPSSEY